MFFIFLGVISYSFLSFFTMIHYSKINDENEKGIFLSQIIIFFFITLPLLFLVNHTIRISSYISLIILIIVSIFINMFTFTEMLISTENILENTRKFKFQPLFLLFFMSTLLIINYLLFYNFHQYILTVS